MTLKETGGADPPLPGFPIHQLPSIKHIALLREDFSHGKSQV